MEYCGPRGIPHSRFLSWSAQDQDLALAWLIDGRLRCPRCNTYEDEWIDEDGLPQEPVPYTVETHRCYGCVDMEDALEKVPTDQKSTVTVRFVRNTSGD